jgi:hypothetical protein
MDRKIIIAWNPESSRELNLLDSGGDVKMKFKFLTFTLSIFLFQICALGYAESEIPHVFKYSFSTSIKYDEHSVTFNHAKHAMEYKITCVACHHELEAGAAAVEENCLGCHGTKAIRNNQQKRRISKEKRAQPYLIVLHDMCVRCHKEIKANNPYLKVPVSCWRCHIRGKKSRFN